MLDQIRVLYPPVIGVITAPKWIHILIPGTCEYATYDKGDCGCDSGFKIGEIILDYPEGPVSSQRFSKVEI